MAGTKIGGLKAAIKNKENHGELFYQIIGSKGGKKTGIIKGFAAMTPEKRKELGARGGSITGDRYKTRTRV